MPKYTVTLHVRAEDRLRLQNIQKKPKIIFIANRLAKGLDEVVLLQLLQPFYPSIKAISFSIYTNDFQEYDEFIIKRNLSNIHKILKTTDDSVLALSLYFSPLYQLPLNQFFRTLRDENWLIVPIYLSSEAAAVPNLEKILLQVKKTLTPHQLPQLWVRVGLPISVSTLSSFKEANDLRRFVQSRLFALAKNQENISTLISRRKTKNADIE